jgi:hypothetical protein
METDLLIVFLAAVIAVVEVVEILIADEFDDNR